MPRSPKKNLVKDLEAIVKSGTIKAYLNLNKKRRINNDYLRAILNRAKKG